ncbi:MAG: hypothetical protein F6K30_06995 [Cyanothece sp. SIO2G6]|nr:hypothetical protein [Cyanothece sp. SIO2G6]
MKHYVAYNKVKDWKDYSVDIGQIEFDHYSQHSQSKLEKTIGQSIWVISGKKINGSMAYKLCSIYQATHIEHRKERNPKTGEIESYHCVVGEGLGFIPPIDITDCQWFPKFLKKQGNFGFGLNQINDETVVQSLEKIRDNYLGSNQIADGSNLTILQELEQHKDSYENLPETTRTSIIQSRIGQGQFKRSLIQYWQGCSVSSYKQIEVLRASHIKPWRCSSNVDRLNVFNGLLLLPNLDACFDSGLISFDDDGRVIISRKLDKSTMSHLGITLKLKLLRVEEKHKVFLSFHRDNIFRY